MTRFEPSVDMREVVGAALGWASAQAKATSICAALEAQWVSTCSAALDSQGVKLGGRPPPQSESMCKRAESCARAGAGRRSAPRAFRFLTIVQSVAKKGSPERL
eukprot:2690707-Pyramimonas_sp.AAC.1